MGTSSTEMPRWRVLSGSVRTSRMMKSAWLQYEVQIFEPLMTYSSPTRSA